MATYNKFIRTNCNYEVSVYGPHEFKGKNGDIETLPHPGGRNADRLYLNVYCPHCDKNQQLIIVEYIQPAENPFETTIENIKKEYLAITAPTLEDTLKKPKSLLNVSTCLI